MCRYRVSDCSFWRVETGEHLLCFLEKEIELIMVNYLILRPSFSEGMQQTIQFFPSDIDPEQLFDLQDDPLELSDIANN